MPRPQLENPIPVILAQSHAFPALWLVLHRIPQAAGDYIQWLLS